MATPRMNAIPISRVIPTTQPARTVAAGAVSVRNPVTITSRAVTHHKPAVSAPVQGRAAPVRRPPVSSHVRDQRSQSLTSARDHRRPPQAGPVTAITSAHVEAITRNQGATLPRRKPVALVAVRRAGASHPTPQHPPGNTSVDRDSMCRCGEVLAWGSGYDAAAQPVITCSRCQLRHFLRVRFINTFDFDSRLQSMPAPYHGADVGDATAGAHEQATSAVGAAVSQPPAKGRVLGRPRARSYDHTSRAQSSELPPTATAVGAGTVPSTRHAERLGPKVSQQLCGDPGRSSSSTQHERNSACDSVAVEIDVRVNDYRWAALWETAAAADGDGSTSDQRVEVWQQSQCIAVVSKRAACFWRAVYLAAQPRLSRQYRVNEADVTAFIVALLLSNKGVFPAVEIPARFRGEFHQFAPVGTPFEPGFTRPASLPCKVTGLAPHFSDPSTSAYCDVAEWHSPLTTSVIRDKLLRHPLGVYWYNGLQFGFSTQSEPPLKFRPARRTGTPSAQLEAVTQEEVDDGGFVDATDWPMDTPVRIHPWFGVESSGKFRGICDLSWGNDSHNACTRRAPLLPIRLAKWTEVARRIEWLRQQHPGRRIVLAKLDAKRAYRQLPVPRRDFFKMVHQIGSKRYANVRMAIGGKSSSDSMAPGISMIAELAALEHGYYAASYCDDQLLIAYEDEMPRTLAWFIRTWRKWGWRVNEKKLRAAGRPSTSITFLGVQLDTATCTASITDDRKAKIIAELDEWITGSARVSVKRVRRLAGMLAFVSAVVPFSTAYMRAMYESQSDHVRTEDIALEAEWWKFAIQSMNGEAKFAVPRNLIPQLHASTDASRIGWGWYAPSVQAFGHGKWSSRERMRSSTVHWEGAAIVFAAYALAKAAAGGLLVIHTDSDSCQCAFRQCKCFDAKLLTLLRFAVSLQIQHRFVIRVIHLPGRANGISDAFSRGKVRRTPSAWTRRMPTSQQRALGGVLCLRKPYARRSLELRQALRSNISQSTARLTTTSHQPTLVWTAWNHLPLDNPSEDVWQTWPDGFVSE